MYLEEIDALLVTKSKGGSHAGESKLNGKKYAGIKYLTLYPSLGKQSKSVRVYFIVKRGCVYLLVLNANKRRTPVTKGEKKKLLQRNREIVQALSRKGSKK